MAADHDPPAAYDDLNVRSIALVGGVGAVLVFVAIVAVQVIFFRYNEQEYQDKVLAVPAREADRMVADQRTRLTTPGPGADQEKGETRVPIEQAMASVVTEYRERQSAQTASPTERTEAQSETDAAAPEAEAAAPEGEAAEADRPAVE